MGAQCYTEENGSQGPNEGATACMPGHHGSYEDRTNSRLRAEVSPPADRQIYRKSGHGHCVEFTKHRKLDGGTYQGSHKGVGLHKENNLF